MSKSMKDQYKELVVQAEAAVKNVKEDELRYVAFGKILDDLLDRSILKKFAESLPPDKIVAKSHELNSEGAFARGWLDCRNFVCNRLKAAMEEQK